MKIRTLALRVVTITIMLGAIALLASPNQHIGEIWGLFAIWVLSDAPESRAWQALTADERAAAGMESKGRAAAKYVVLVLLFGIAIFMARIRHLSGASDYLITIVMPVAAFVVGTSLFRWRRLSQIQVPVAYRRAFVLTSVLQLVVLGLASWMGAPQ